MSKKHMRQVITAWMLAGLVLSSVTVWAPTALMAAPVAQTLEAQEVGGTLTGGEFAKIWLEVTPNNRGEEMAIISTWDRSSPATNGVGFYVLDENGLREVLSGSADVREANLAAASRLSQESPDNELGTVVQATGGSYTIVLFNDSGADANFTLSVENGVISDDSNQVRDLNAAPTSEADEADDEEADGEETDTDEGDTAEETEPEEAVATPEPAADETESDVDETADEAVDETEADDETGSEEMTDDETVMAVDGVVEAQELEGELPNQNDQHYLALEPDTRDASVVLTLGFDPQDSSELARRLNFWVLDQTGFDRYVNPESNVILSQVALAAGSSAPELADNQRQAQFTVSGLGPYVVIVYNNAEVPGSYTLTVDGGLLIDDSGQTLTAQQAATGAIGATAGDADDETADGDDSADTGTADASTETTTGTTTSTREGNPGSAYTVQSGDTLSLIARDIYGDLDLWRGICSFNDLADCNAIEVGQVLQLPTLAEIDAGDTAPASSTADATASTETDAAAATETEGITGTAGTEAESGTTDDAAESDVDSSTSVTSTTTTTDTATADEEADGDAESGDETDILTTLEAEGSFGTLVQALEAAALTDSLRTAGPFTIIAPTDAAFAELPEGALDQLLANPTGQLTQILLFHVLPGEVASGDITNGMQATTQQGQAVTFETGDGSTRVNGANISVADIEADNGLIHAIDTVLLPPSEE